MTISMTAAGKTLHINEHIQV